MIDVFTKEKLILPHGKAIAIGKLIDCRPMEIGDEDKCFVQYYPDLWCHIYEDVKPIKSFEWKGVQGWKTLDEKTIEQIKIQKLK